MCSSRKLPVRSESCVSEVAATAPCWGRLSQVVHSLVVVVLTGLLSGGRVRPGEAHAGPGPAGDLVPGEVEALQVEDPGDPRRRQRRELVAWTRVCLSATHAWLFLPRSIGYTQ